VSARVSVLVYNPKLIPASDLPTSVLALADPKYKGLLGIAPGETDFQPIVIAVAEKYGDAAAVKWLKGIAANAGESREYGSNEALVDEVNRGAAAFGLLNQYYWYRLGKEIGTANVHSKIAFLAPHDPGYVVDVSGAAVLASSSPPGCGPEVRKLSGVQGGPADHRHVPQLRVPDRLRGDHQ
jgi:iron(III) transport system substrate-binding protein